MQTKQIIAASVVLGFSFLSIMALVTRILLQTKHTDDNSMDVPTSSNQSLQHLLKISTSWKRIFASKKGSANGNWVPTLSGIVKAGDEGLFSSALFADLHGHPGEPSLQALYEVFAKELRSRPMTERSAYTGGIPQFLSSTKQVTSGPRRAQSASHRTTRGGRADGSLKTSRKSLDVSAAERGFARSLSVKKPAPVLVSMRDGLTGSETSSAVHTSWMKDGRNAELSHGSISVIVTPAELVALSIALGSPLLVDGKTGHDPTKTGAFNISISESSTEDGKQQITLQQHKRGVSHMPARGSGHSTLFAKHFAAGSLPFSQDKKTVHTMLVSTQTLRAVQAGSSISLLDAGSVTPQSRFLDLLPSSREITFHSASPSTRPTSSNPLIDAISALPFVGGLVPLASSPLIQTIQFVVSGGLPPARLLQRLEGLVDKVNSFAPHLNIFGPLYEPRNAALLYRERERLGRLATRASTSDSVADKASRMQRYITLLERLMALIPNMKQHDILVAVQEAMKKEIECSYIDAVAAHQINHLMHTPETDSHIYPELDTRTNGSSTRTHNRSGRSSDTSLSSIVSPSSSNGLPPRNLGKEVEQLLKADLPLSVESVAVVARMVIVAWTLSVEVVAWEEGEQGFRVPDLAKLSEKRMVLC
jgi:hypothetical protein